MEIKLQVNSPFKISGILSHHIASWEIIRSGKNILRHTTNFQISFADELQQHYNKSQLQFSDHEKIAIS